MRARKPVLQLHFLTLSVRISPPPANTAISPPVLQSAMSIVEITMYNAQFKMNISIHLIKTMWIQNFFFLYLNTFSSFIFNAFACLSPKKTFLFGGGEVLITLIPDKSATDNFSSRSGFFFFSFVSSFFLFIVEVKNLALVTGVRALFAGWFAIFVDREAVLVDRVETLIVLNGFPGFLFLTVTLLKFCSTIIKFFSQTL